MKTLKDLKGVKELSKNEQKSLCGGKLACDPQHPCPPGTCCVNYVCTMYCI